MLRLDRLTGLDAETPALGDTRAVRPTEQLDWDALASYLRLQLPDHAIAGLDLSRELEVAQFPGGHSNLTYLVRFGGAELVVRRPPLGPVPPTAHDMAREYRWLAALHPVFPLAPRPYLLCEDPSVIGSVFYVMERRRGIVVRHDEPLGLANRPEERRRVERGAGRHAGRSARHRRHERPARGARQAGRLRRAPGARVDRALAAVEDGRPAGDGRARRRGWRARCRPTRSSPSVVHGDFKLDNVLLDPLDLGRVVAVFDWEMSALGDPLVDLGILLAYWSPTAPPEQRDALTTVTDRPGLADARRDRRALRRAVGPRRFDDPLLRDVRALQDRRRHPADLLSATCEGRPTTRGSRRSASA